MTDHKAIMVDTLDLGAKLTPKHDKLDCFRSEFKKRIIGRTAIVVGHTYPNRNPILVFPKDGRKQELKFGGNYSMRQLGEYFSIAGSIISMELGK